jgi:uncharacterized protein (TIGR00369 family)
MSDGGAVPAAIAEFFSRVPINLHLGTRLLACAGGRAEIAMPVLPDYRQEGGVVQGGIVSAAADAAAAYSLLQGLAPGHTMMGVEFKINFLAPALVEGGDLLARARVVRQGRSLGVSEVEVYQGDRQVALGLFTFLFRPA